MRVFIALLFSEKEKKLIFKELKSLAINFKGNYVKYDNLHLTMYYIGEIDSCLLKNVITGIKTIDFPKFNYKTLELDCFKNKKNQCLLHLKIKNNAFLYKLRNIIISVLNDAGININKHKFTPHITLGRKVKIKQEDLKNINNIPLKFNANKISIMESKRINGELVYHELDFHLLK
ncbi:MAG: RNA 2',3'-cyclic phosphodiesterase [Bacillota bacterium]